MAAVADPLDPSLLRLIDTVRRAAGATVRVAVCGEVASEPAAVPLLRERLRGELDGILAWAAEGYRQWQDRGLAEPEQVTATERDESDSLGLFLAQRCMTNPHAHVQSSVLFGMWVDWCRREDVEPGTHTGFSRELTKGGFDKDHTRVGWVWQGIDLYADETGQNP